MPALRTWFDEAYDANGRLRDAYASLARRLGWDPTQPSSAVAERLRVRPFGDDSRIFAVPVVLGAEYQLGVQAGVAQRAYALARLFADLVIGSLDICAAGIGLTEDVAEMIAASEGTTLPGLREIWSGRQPGDVRFVYGPDLIRDADGSWVVIEDNVGCVGGSADAYFVACRYRDAAGLTEPSQRPDLAVAVERLLGQLDRQPGATVAVLGSDGSSGPLALRIEENARRSRLLTDLSIPIIDQDQVDHATDRRDGAAAVTVLNFGVDASWVDLFRRPGVALLNCPGTPLLGSKALLPFTDAVVRFYTGEDPILPTAKTELLSDGRLPPGPGWVVKHAAGCQGNEVFMVDRLSSDQRRQLEDRLQGDWSRKAAVAQRYVEPSRLAPSGSGWDGYQVELRPVTYVLGDDVYVSEQAVGKVVSTYDARRLNNISAGASYVPVLRE